MVIGYCECINNINNMDLTSDQIHFRNYAGSDSIQYRVSAAVAQKNLGYRYLSEVSYMRRTIVLILILDRVELDYSLILFNWQNKF